MLLQKTMEKIGAQAKTAAVQLSLAPAALKNKALTAMADALVKDTELIMGENAADMNAARKSGMKDALLDRLLLTNQRIFDMAQGLRQVAALPDPVGEIISGHETAGGLTIAKVRVPFGVVGIIYEARPNVTADAAGLCLKTGNAVILRGGSEAFNSNKMIAAILSNTAQRAGLPEHCVQFVETTDRQAVDIMLKLNGCLDVIIPRGGAGLIQKVVQESRVPVIETGVGVCHTFVDESADFTMAGDIVFNAKASRPSVCNALETLLVHRNVAPSFLPQILERLAKAGATFYADEEVCRLWPDAQPATEESWRTEYGDLRMSVKIVDSLDGALQHIARYGSKHSEAIVTLNLDNARRFQKETDAAAVYVNASTRFTDGFEFGFGAEIGISTQKLHARGPMGLKELTSFKYIINGSGQIR